MHPLLHALGSAPKFIKSVLRDQDTGVFYIETVDGQHIKLTAEVLDEAPPAPPNHVGIRGQSAFGRITSFHNGIYQSLRK